MLTGFAKFYQCTGGKFSLNVCGVGVRAILVTMLLLAIWLYYYLSAEKSRHLDDDTIKYLAPFKSNMTFKFKLFFSIPVLFCFSACKYSARLTQSDVQLYLHI